MGNTPVEVYGQLSVKESRIIDKNQKLVQLRGMSLFWSQWKAQYWNKDIVNWLSDDWEINVIRAAMGIDKERGYIFNHEEKQKVEAIVDAAIEKGIYVIVDWHSHHAEDYMESAISFFKAIAQKYGKYPNLIYEIYNEPLEVSWSKTIKPYAESVIRAIREFDQNNIIIVGTPSWSQNVEEAGADPIKSNNIAYAFHFYASDPKHYNSLMAKFSTAIAAGTPLFVTEWGVSEANGDGKFNQKWTNKWLKLLNDNQISWCNWSVTDKAETSAALLTGANSKGGWKLSELSASGIFVRNELRKDKGYNNP